MAPDDAECQILSAGGCDDSHEYHDLDNPASARPGQAWIVARAPMLTTEEITRALRAGDFYALTGVTLERGDLCRARRRNRPAARWWRAPALAQTVEYLLKHRDLTIQDAEVVVDALVHYKTRPSLGFSDCLVLEIARKAGHMPLGTFDRTLAKLDGVEGIAA